MNAAHVWQAALGELELELTRATYNAWLRNARLVSYEDGVFVIGVANGYARDWLESRLRSTVVRTLTRLAKRTVDVRFVVWEEPPAPETAPLLQPLAELPANNSKASNGLNPRYTFSSFIVGPGNRLAQAACQAVAEQPAVAFNPLFIYGGVGLGKTHLLHAIGNHCQPRDRRVVYVSAETFTNQLIEAIRNHNTEAFRETYRTADVLLIDDIHFIAGKEATQEEFFHTFNALHGNGAQIVISSDRPPRAMSLLEERLRSRFEWGLLVDIQPPELETRVAILRQKAASRDAAVPDEILYLIAEHIHNNIRELEGALNRVIAITTLANQPLTGELALAAIGDLAIQKPSPPDAEAIVRAVATYYHLSLEDLTGPSRARPFARPRQVAMYLLRQETDASLCEISQALGRQDHTTVLHACERVAALMDQDPTLHHEIQAIREALYREKPLHQPAR